MTYEFVSHTHVHGLPKWPGWAGVRAAENHGMPDFHGLQTAGVGGARVWGAGSQLPLPPG